jgi:outer membrane protein insertion porin family
MVSRVGANALRHLVVSFTQSYGGISGLVLVCILAFAPMAQAQNFQFRTIEVSGNQRIPDASVLRTAELSAGQSFTGGQVNDALQRLQNSGLFQTVEFTTRGQSLVIIVQEFSVINRVVFEGNARLNDDQLETVIQSTPRQSYSPSVAEQDAARIAQAYFDSGRLNASVTPQVIELSGNRVNLVFEISEGRIVETESIAFVGNRAYSDRRLRRVLESTQAGLLREIIRRDTFVADRIALDRELLTTFYLDRGYIDFRLLNVTSELSRERDAYFITFNIQEGQSFSYGNITAVSEIAEANAQEFQNAIRLRPGMVYSPRTVDATITRMENLATQQGLRFVRIEPRITRNNQDQTVDIEFVISRGDRVFVERINIEGNVTTLDRVIRRQFDVVEGDPFDPRAIRAAAERIRATGLFGDVEVEGRGGTSADQVIVDVDVEEQPTGSFGLSLGYSGDTGAGIALNFTQANFLGRGQRIGFNLNTTEGSQTLSFAFTEPAFLRRDLEFGFDAFYRETTQQNRRYDTLDIGLGASLEFPIAESSRLRFSYGIEQSEISNFTIGSSSPILEADAGERLNSFIGLRYSYDTINSGLNPTAGVRIYLDTEFAGLGGDAEYARVGAGLTAERRVAREEVTLRASFEAGVLETFTGNSRVSDRFFFNSRRMRGFDALGLGPRDTAALNNDPLGGNFMAVARLEALFPLGLPDEYNLTGGVFADIGSVWGLDDTNGDGGVQVDAELHWRTVVGVSLFWDSIIGPLRFNFSRALDTQPYDITRDFDFTIETRF